MIARKNKRGTGLLIGLLVFSLLSALIWFSIPDMGAALPDSTDEGSMTLDPVRLIIALLEHLFNSLLWK